MEPEPGRAGTRGPSPPPPPPPLRSPSHVFCLPGHLLCSWTHAVMTVNLPKAGPLLSWSPSSSSSVLRERALSSGYPSLSQAAPRAPAFGLGTCRGGGLAHCVNGFRGGTLRMTGRFWEAAVSGRSSPTGHSAPPLCTLSSTLTAVLPCARHCSRAWRFIRGQDT